MALSGILTNHTNQTVNPKDLFQLAVRILGLVFLYRGLSSLPMILTPISIALAGGQFVSFWITIFDAVWPLAVALWLLRGAPFIMRLAYPDTDNS